MTATAPADAASRDTEKQLTIHRSVQDRSWRDQLVSLRKNRELAGNLVLRELRSKYKNSALGWLWSLANPLATVAIYSLVFKFFLKIEPPIGDPSGLDNFALHLLVGLVAWNFFSGGLNTAMTSLTANANLIKKVYFPREILVGAGVIGLAVSLMIELAVVLAIFLIAGNMVLPWIPVALGLVVLLIMFTLGIGLGLSVANVYFRDVGHIVGIALQALFYLTPIIYPISLIEEEGERILFWYRLNPLTRFVESFRDLFYHLRFPGLGDWLYLTAWSVAVLVTGYAIFVRFSARVPEEL